MKHLIKTLYHTPGRPTSFVEGSGRMLQNGLFCAWDHWPSLQTSWAALNGLTYAVYVLPTIGAPFIAVGRYAALRSLIIASETSVPAQK